MLQEGMVGVERQAVGTAALDRHALAAGPILRVRLDRVTGPTEGLETIHGGEGLAAALNAHDVIDVLGHDLPAVQRASLAQGRL